MKHYLNFSGIIESKLPHPYYGQNKDESRSREFVIRTVGGTNVGSSGMTCHRAVRLTYALHLNM
jgi:hypothetical protein